MPTLTLQEQFGQIDIYLFDQLLKGRILPGMRILDAGCGAGAEAIWLALSTKPELLGKPWHARGSSSSH